MIAKIQDRKLTWYFENVWLPAHHDQMHGSMVGMIRKTVADFVKFAECDPPIGEITVSTLDEFESCSRLQKFRRTIAAARRRRIEAIVHHAMPPKAVAQPVKTEPAECSLRHYAREVLITVKPELRPKTIGDYRYVVNVFCRWYGLDVFSKFRIHRRYKVLVCSSESGMATIQETARRICKALGIELSDIENLIFTTAVPKPNNGESLAAFRDALLESGAEVVFCDPFYRMFDGEGQESIFKMGTVLGKLAELCDELAVTLILCHHLKTSRLNQYAPAELDDLAYAGCAEFFRQWILLARREVYQPGSGHHALWMTVGGSAGHNSLWALDIDEGHADAPGGRTWAALLNRADDARNAAEQRKVEAKSVKATQQFNDDCNAIRGVLLKHPNGATKTFLRDHVGFSERRFPSVLAAMYEGGEIVDCKVQVGNKKQPHSGFKLNTESA